MVVHLLDLGADDAVFILGHLGFATLCLGWPVRSPARSRLGASPACFCASSCSPKVLDSGWPTVLSQLGMVLGLLTLLDGNERDQTMRAKGLMAIVSPGHRDPPDGLALPRVAHDRTCPRRHEPRIRGRQAFGNPSEHDRALGRCGWRSAVVRTTAPRGIRDGGVWMAGRPSDVDLQRSTRPVRSLRWTAFVAHPRRSRPRGLDLDDHGPVHVIRLCFAGLQQVPVAGLLLVPAPLQHGATRGSTRRSRALAGDVTRPLGGPGPRAPTRCNEMDVVQLVLTRVPLVLGPSSEGTTVVCGQRRPRQWDRA